MNTWKNTKEQIKYIGRKYFNYDLGLRMIKLGNDFVDQKLILNDIDVKTIFDVGANIGQTTKKYRKLFPEAIIHSFEPFPNTFNTFIKNTAGDKNITANRFALSNKSGKASFYSNECHYTNSLLPVSESFQDEKNYRSTIKTEVETQTLDEYCSKNNIDNIDILKMDVQGGELFILEGARVTLSRNAIKLIYSEVEFEPIYKGQPLFTDLEAYLKKFGYKVHAKYNISYSADKTPVTGDVIFIKEK